MNSQEPIQFDDPDLKAAIRRVWPVRQASDATRRRVEEILRAGCAEPQVEQSERRFRIGFFPRAIAAVLVLGIIGVVAYQMYEAAEQREYVEANEDNFKAMVEAHRGAPPASSAPALTPAQLAAQLDRPIASLPATTAQIQSARTVPFGLSVLAIVTYEGDRRVSVISLPASALVEAHDGFAYDIQIENYQLVGAVRGENLFCVIADPGSNPQDIRDLAGQLTMALPQ